MFYLCCFPDRFRSASGAATRALCWLTSALRQLLCWRLGYLRRLCLGLLLSWLLKQHLARARDCPPVVDEQHEVFVFESVKAHKINSFEKREAARLRGEQMLNGFHSSDLGYLL